ncbi:hypothetical protein IGI84_002555 [Enterococcus sp. DIV0008]
MLGEVYLILFSFLILALFTTMNIYILIVGKFLCVTKRF